MRLKYRRLATSEKKKKKVSSFRAVHHFSVMRSLESFAVVSRLLFVLESAVFSVTFWVLYLLKTRL